MYFYSADDDDCWRMITDNSFFSSFFFFCSLCHKLSWLARRRTIQMMVNVCSTVFFRPSFDTGKNAFFASSNIYIYSYEWHETEIFKQCLMRMQQIFIVLLFEQRFFFSFVRSCYDFEHAAKKITFVLVTFICIWWL